VEIRRRDRGADAAFAPQIVDRHDAFRLRVGERPEQDRVHHAEDRGVRTDSERQRTDGQQRERRLTAQRAGGVAKILQNGVHVCPPDW
jgi:hypothetical protein